MIQTLKGMPVVNAISEDLKNKVEELKAKNIVPTLAVVRVGAREDDLSYERGIIKRFSGVGAEVKICELPEDVTQEAIEETVKELNESEKIHGILVFRPLPKHLSEERINNIISPEKDVDCSTLVNMAQVFAGDSRAYPPCTPQAVVELLKYYEYDLSGKKVVIVGRSMVVGKPLAMLMLKENATVTVCHTRTKDLKAECRNADIIVACAGVAKLIDGDYVTQGQTVIDVGIHEVDGKLCGDVDFEAIENTVSAATPVPGGVGTVTTSILLKHTVRSASEG